jgi:hypothetical protein
VCEPRQDREVAALNPKKSRFALNFFGISPEPCRSEPTPAKPASADNFASVSRDDSPASGVGVCEPRQDREVAALSIPPTSRGLVFGRIAQRESARFTRERSLVRSQVRPSAICRVFRFGGVCRSSLSVGLVGLLVS